MGFIGNQNSILDVVKGIIPEVAAKSGPAPIDFTADGSHGHNLFDPAPSSSGALVHDMPAAIEASPVHSTGTEILY